MEKDNRPPAFDVARIEERFKNIKTLSDLTGKDGIIQEMIKQTVERILKAEQEAHLGYEPYKKDGKSADNSRNGYSQKKFKTPSGEVEIDIPRDRKGTFEPMFVAKHQSFDPDLEKRVTSMYARGMSTRDIGQQLQEFYGTEVSPALISKITDKVLEGVQAWQNRPLEDVYAVIFMDAIHYKIRQDAKVITKAAYTCMGINLQGKVDVLGLWIAENEGAHFWLTVLNDLKARGVSDILIACVDGLKGFPEAIETAFPNTRVQLCVVHQIRSSLRYLGTRYHKEFLKDLKEIYRAPTLELAEMNLLKLDEKWSEKCRYAVAGWKDNWVHLSTFFAFPQEIRKMIYTTNAVEALHRQYRKVTKTKGAFPTDDALKKILYLATLDLKGAFRSKRDWPMILGQLKIVFGDRVQENAI